MWSSRTADLGLYERSLGAHVPLVRTIKWPETDLAPFLSGLVLSPQPWNPLLYVNWMQLRFDTTIHLGAFGKSSICTSEDVAC